MFNDRKHNNKNLVVDTKTEAKSSIQKIVINKSDLHRDKPWLVCPTLTSNLANPSNHKQIQKQNENSAKNGNKHTHELIN